MAGSIGPRAFGQNRSGSPPRPWIQPFCWRIRAEYSLRAGAACPKASRAWNTSSAGSPITTPPRPRRKRRRGNAFLIVVLVVDIGGSLRRPGDERVRRHELEDEVLDRHGRLRPRARL